MKALGIQVRGSSIEGAIVDTERGVILTKPYQIAVEAILQAKDITRAARQIARHFEWYGLVGCGFPAVITHGFARTATHIDKAFINTNINELLTKTLGVTTYCINDADAIGIVEIAAGEGRGLEGTIVLVTLDTGLGTALFVNGKLVPNTELGHILLENGLEAETMMRQLLLSDCSPRSAKWAEMWNLYLARIEQLFWPDLFILSGSAGHRLPEFIDLLAFKTPVVAAAMHDQACLVGAAIYAGMEAEHLKRLSQKAAI